MNKKSIEALRSLIETTARLLKEAEGAEHARLRELLEDLATEAGFPEAAGDLDGCIPDVFRIGSTYRRIFFVADAKDAANQRVADSRDQIAGYLVSLAKRFRTGWKGSIFMIATNDGEAAREWEAALPGIATEAKVTVVGVNLIPCDERTFLVAMAVRK
jgi:hypothetical protein